jgi:hypothetical protein
MNYAYRLATLKLESDLELLELSPWDGPAAAQADVAVRFGKVPLRFETPDRVEAIFQTRGRDEYLLSLPGTGRILIRHGREVTVEPEADADPLYTRALLTGPMQAMLWHQRGLLPLHANAVAIGDRAVALAGPSAAGKSTLAAILARDGHLILADDVCAVDIGANPPRATVLPGVAPLRLWRDTIERLGLPLNGLRRALSDKEKFLVDRWSGCREPRRLAAVIVLARRMNVALAIERLEGPLVDRMLRGVVHMRRQARALCREEDVSAGLAQMTQAGVTVWRLKVPDDPGCLEQAAAKVKDVLEQS